MKVLLILGVFVLCGLAFCEEEEDTENDLEDAHYYPPRCYYKRYCVSHRRCYLTPYKCRTKKVCNRYILRYAKTCKRVCYNKGYYPHCRKVCKYNRPIYKYGCRKARICRPRRRVCRKYPRCYRKRICQPRRHGYHY